MMSISKSVAAAACRNEDVDEWMKPEMQLSEIVTCYAPPSYQGLQKEIQTDTNHGQLLHVTRTPNRNQCKGRKLGVHTRRRVP